MTQNWWRILATKDNEPENEEKFKDFEDEEDKTGLNKNKKKTGLEFSSILPVLMFACNRPTVSKALDSLLKIRNDPERFPIIVSQDCGHQETKKVIQGVPRLGSA